MVNFNELLFVILIIVFINSLVGIVVSGIDYQKIVTDINSSAGLDINEIFKREKLKNDWILISSLIFIVLVIGSIILYRIYNGTKMAVAIILIFIVALFLNSLVLICLEGLDFSKGLIDSKYISKNMYVLLSSIFYMVFVIMLVMNIYSAKFAIMYSE